MDIHNTQTVTPINSPVVDVTIASAWKRIAAVLINNIIFVTSLLPVVFWNLDKQFEQFHFALLWLLPVIITIAQIILLCKHGQSIGKRLMNIRLLKTDGSNPSFTGAILLREVVFDLILTAISSIFIFLVSPNLSSSNGLSEMISVLAYLVCLIMLFTAKDRRTLQDWLAGTIVVQLPKKP